MRKLKYLMLTAFFLSAVISCDNVDFGDINENKNGSTEPSTAGLLSGAIMTHATFTNRTGVTIPTLYVQYQSQVTYTDEMLYAQTPYGWGTYYQGILFPLSEIIRICSDEDLLTTQVLANGSANNQIGVAKIYRAMIMKRVTDLYGNAPFSEAFGGLSEITPAYDDQEDIYKKLISELKEARDLIDEDEATVTGDIIYSGDLARWKMLANSVILQMALQLSNVYPANGEYADTEFEAALNDPNGVIETIEDEAWYSYQDLVGFRSPWFDNRTADYFLSAEFINAMNGCETCPTVSDVETENPTSSRVADSRKLIYARHDHQSREGVPYGYSDQSGADRAQMSTRYYWNATASIPVVTSSYVYLNRAEAAALGWTSEDVNGMLSEGILKSFETLQAKANRETATSVAIPVVDGTSYAAARIAQVGVDAPALQIIGEEKWKSLFGQAYDAWTEWRRTGFPDLAPATDSYNGGVIPRRFMYPGEEASLNGTNYSSAVSALSPGEDKNTSQVWWDN